MGNCTSSCLGRGSRDVYDEDEESRLIFDDPNNLQYNSFGDSAAPDDPLEVQRENEALQRVIAKASDNMVDIYEIAPQEATTIPGSGRRALRAGPSPFGYAGQEARLVRYQNLLAKLSLSPDNATVAAGAQVDLLADDDVDEDAIELARGAAARGPDAPLVGTFADAAQAMA